MPTVLIVDDEAWLLDLYEFEFGGKVTILRAQTIKQAQQLFAENRTCLDAIILDGHVEGKDATATCELARDIRAIYKGHMIAVSGLDEYCVQLVGAGCNYRSSKDHVVKLVLRILGLG